MQFSIRLHYFIKKIYNFYTENVCSERNYFYLCVCIFQRHRTTMNKKDRLETLMMLISTYEMTSQVEVQEALRKRGFEVTQATLSRDFKQLKVAKAAAINGTSVYVLPKEMMFHRVKRVKNSEASDNGKPEFEIHFSQNMAVMKTRPGYASAVAYNIDSAHIPDILGTIAGDDTIFMVLAENARREKVEAQLKDIMKKMG